MVVIFERCCAKYNYKPPCSHSGACKWFTKWFKCTSRNSSFSNFDARCSVTWDSRCNVAIGIEVKLGRRHVMLVYGYQTLVLGCKPMSLKGIVQRFETFYTRRNIVHFNHHFATSMQLSSKPTTFATMIFVILCVHVVASIYHYMCA